MMLSVVSSYIWGMEEAGEKSSSREDDWVLLEKPEEEGKFFVSSVAHSVPLIPSSGPSSVSHTLTDSPANIGASFLAHQATAPSSKAITTSTQTYRPRLAAFVPLFGNANIKKEEEDNEEVVVLAHYCNGQKIKIENVDRAQTYRPRAKALVPLFGNTDGRKGETDEDVVVLAHYCNGQEIKLEREEMMPRKQVDDNPREERHEDEDVVLLAHYYNGTTIKQEKETEAKLAICNTNEKNEQTDYNDEVVVLAHYYNGQQIKQEKADNFQSFTLRNEALDFLSKNSEEEDEVEVVAHFYNGHHVQQSRKSTLAPLFEETLMEENENEDEVVVLAHYQNGRQINLESCSLGPSSNAFLPFIGPLLEEERDDNEEEVVVLAHYYNGQQIKQEKETFAPFIGPLEEGQSRRLASNQKNPSSETKYEEEVEDDKEDVVLLAHYHKGQRVDTTSPPPWSPARALNFSGNPLAITGPSKLALTYQVME